jgi:hypothetical protein
MSTPPSPSKRGNNKSKVVAILYVGWTIDFHFFMDLSPHFDFGSGVSQKRFSCDVKGPQVAC